MAYENIEELIKKIKVLELQIEQCDTIRHKLEKSETSLAQAQRIARMGNWDWDIVTNDLHWSDEIFRIFGLDPEEFEPTYKAFLHTIHPDDKDSVLKAVERALAQEEDYHVEHRIILPDGTIRVVLEQGKVYLDEQKNSSRMIGTVQDITEQKAMETELRQSEERFRTVANTAVDAIIIADAKGTILFWNIAASKIFAYSQDEVIGKPASILMPRHYVEKHERGMKNYHQTGESDYLGNILEFEGTRKDGSEFPLELAVSSWTNGGERFFTAIIRDSTIRKELEKELIHLATRDGLTDLFNRSSFNTKFAKEIERALRYDKPLSLVILDIDNFKLLNDTYGHPAGDAFLQATAQVILDNIRNIDIAARLGGEEFVLILPETMMDSAMNMAERLRQQMESKTVEYNNMGLSKTISVGVASLSESYNTFDTLLKAADDALYVAKRKGKNCIACANND